MDYYYTAWGLYLLGTLGLGLALWRLVRRRSREWRHLVLVTYAVLMLTPFATDPETFTMAPALFILVLDPLAESESNVVRILFVMLGVWLLALMLSLFYQIMTRKPVTYHPDSEGLDAYHNPEAGGKR